MLLRYCATFIATAVLSAAPASVEESARRILASRCWSCHAQTASGGLRLDSFAGIGRGGKSKQPLVVPGDPGKSQLYQAVTGGVEGLLRMPPGPTPLPADEIEALARWIREGAPWTEPGSAEQHWSFQPLRQTNPTATIDSLITASLARQKLTPNPRADKRTLIRRIYFDLIGLPPTEAEFDRAFHDDSQNWLETLVRGLLASPHFGEKWGRHWLDVARFGEDDFSGTAVIPYANAWRYRDWVVEAINKGVPYDRFLMAQLAGDRMNDGSLLPATGLLGGGPWYYGIAQPAQSRADERNDRVDVVTRGMLGVTVACARCHDHKYDPITAKDYYALAGVFASTAYREYPLVPEAEAQAWKDQKKAVDEAEKALNRFLDQHSARLGEHFGKSIAQYMLATVNGAGSQHLNAKVLARWTEYLSKPEEFHPFLQRWFAGNRTAEEAAGFERLLLEIAAEKKAIDAENRKLVEEANKSAPKVVRTIVLPGGYRSEEDFNPGAYIASKSLERDRFVAYNRTFGEKSSPLKFDRDLTAELLEVEHRQEYERLKGHLETLKKALPQQYPYLMGAGEFEPPYDLQLHRRGNPEDLGEVVPRRFPLALSNGREIPLNQGSGRLQLADTVAHHPLAARVAVNRIWLQLFGQGLVRTPSNFGIVGDRPALPDLLEHLAARFAGKHGYSLKGMIREIVLSEAYQRSSEHYAENAATDPGNRYLWRQSRRRLEAEPLRDAMLAVSGELDRSVGGESKPLGADFHRRTLYARTGRFQQEETLSLFDLPAAAVTCEQRVVTNVPLQKLFFLNSDIVAKRAEALASHIRNESHAAGVDAAYRRLFQRTPTARERQLGLTFLQAAGTDKWKQYAKVLLSSNEFAYVD